MYSLFWQRTKCWTIVPCPEEFWLVSLCVSGGWTGPGWRLLGGGRTSLHTAWSIRWSSRQSTWPCCWSSHHPRPDINCPQHQPQRLTTKPSPPPPPSRPAWPGLLSVELSGNSVVEQGLVTVSQSPPASPPTCLISIVFTEREQSDKYYDNDHLLLLTPSLRYNSQVSTFLLVKRFRFHFFNFIWVQLDKVFPRPLHLPSPDLLLHPPGPGCCRTDSFISESKQTEFSETAQS